MLSWLHRLITTDPSDFRPQEFACGLRFAHARKPAQPWSGRRDSNPRSRRWQRRVLAARRLPHGASSERLELASSLNSRVGNPKHQPLYHARSSKTLAGVTGFEPAKTGFGDQRPSHRVLTPPPQRAKVARRGPRPVAVATGVEPVPPDRQSGILPPDSATASTLAARAGFEPA